MGLRDFNGRLSTLVQEKAFLSPVLDFAIMRFIFQHFFKEKP